MFVPLIVGFSEVVCSAENMFYKMSFILDYLLLYTVLLFKNW